MLDFDCQHEIKPSSSSGDGTQKISADAATVVDLRSHRGRISTIPVLEINKDNLNQLWTYLLVSIKNSSFISVDLELSGLGIEKGWLSQSINDRYKLIRKSAQSRAHFYSTLPETLDEFVANLSD
ncbi:unnamed protein product, partial [Anisakis simplex]|uniref:Target of EGR1 protein 1 (inferred by orthology to a human protein) n=1 Tax=Anisakis simplex TaxID=6269 RepID=A0A0M3KFW2_ANISI